MESHNGLIMETSKLESQVTLQYAAPHPNKSRTLICKHVNLPTEHDIRFSTPSDS